MSLICFEPVCIEFLWMSNLRDVSNRCIYYQNPFDMACPWCTCLVHEPCELTYFEYYEVSSGWMLEHILHFHDFTIWIQIDLNWFSNKSYDFANFTMTVRHKCVLLLLIPSGYLIDFSDLWFEFNHIRCTLTWFGINPNAWNGCELYG